MGEERSVRIGGVDYLIIVQADLRAEGNELDGWVKYRPYQILLDSELDQVGRWIVLWHEILHAILTQAGYSENHPEQQIQALAYGITQVLRDNVWVAEGFDDG